MHVFKDIFSELFIGEEHQKFLGAIPEENLEKLERVITFKGNDNLGAGKKKRRPYIAFRVYGVLCKVLFLTLTPRSDKCKLVNLKDKCRIKSSSPYCKNLKEFSYTYRYTYLVSEFTLKRFSHICGNCLDLEELENIPLGGGEKI